MAWNKGDPTAVDLSSLFSGASAVISCVGVIGGSDAEMERGNGDVNVAAASQVGILVVCPLDRAILSCFKCVCVSPLISLNRAALKKYRGKFSLGEHFAYVLTGAFSLE